MRDTVPPEDSDVRFEVDDGQTWRVAVPPRSRRSHAVHGAAGIGAGVLLGLVSIGGVLEVMTYDSWGAQLFMMGWLGPLGLIGMLLVWLGTKTLSRVWQTTLIESDGATVRHRLIGPWGNTTVFEVPVERFERFELPSEPGDAGETSYVPLAITYRSKNGDEVLTHACATQIRADHFFRLVDALASSFKGASGGRDVTRVG